MRRRGRVVVDERRPVALLGAAVSSAKREHLWPAARAEVSDQSSGKHDRGERCVEGEDRDKRRRGDAPHPSVLQRPRADAVGRMQHQRGDGRLDAVEETRHHGHITEAQVDPAQRDEDEQRRQHEQRTGHDAAPGAVHQPSDVGGELLGFGAGQQHAVVQRMQEPVLADPAPSFDELGMHDRDLACGPAETDEAELEPEAERFGEADRRRLRCRDVRGHGGGIGHVAAPGAA